MVTRMSAEDVAAQIQKADKELRDGKSVSRDELTVNLSPLYKRYRWSMGGATPLPGDALKKLKLADRTSDPRWMAYFNKSAKFIGVYRTQVGYYWILRYESMLNEHYLDHAGSAADLEEKYGGG